MATSMRGCGHQVMQKLGKSAATKDETFVEFVGNFNKQQVGRLFGCVRFSVCVCV